MMTLPGYLIGRHNVHDTPWTNELIERLKTLWAEGYSATQIARALNADITRCGVLGKVHRLQLKARKPRQPRERKNSVPKPPAPPPRPKPPPPPPPGIPSMRRLGLVELRPHQCHWPLGGLLEPVREFCGADVKGEGEYCAFHQGEAYKK